MTSPHRPLMVLSLGLLLVASSGACSGDDEGPTGGGGSAAGGGAGSTGLGQGGVAAIELPYAPCDAAVRVGQFVIALGPGFTSVDGKVADAVSSQVPDELGREGDCRLLKAALTTCTPACPAATQVCDRSSSCVPLPRAHDVGTVTVHGLVVPMTMSANAVTRSYTNAMILPAVAFLPGADLRITATGGDYAPFELRGWGVSPLVLGEPIAVAPGSGTPITWQAPPVAGPSRVDVLLNVNLHGSSKAWIECDFADTGAGDIPATLIDGLIEQGLTGYPTLTATRRSATSQSIEPGCVELLVTADVTADVEVEGIVSCDTSAECPAGQTCLPVERFCD
jgi:hypothetical protein